jgi:hypothetical protein
VFKLSPAVQDEPLYSSVEPVTPGAFPPNPKPAVCVPAPAKLNLAVPKFPPAVQLDRHILLSVTYSAAVVPRPPNAKPAV